MHQDIIVNILGRNFSINESLIDYIEIKEYFNSLCGRLLSSFYKVQIPTDCPPFKATEAIKQHFTDAVKEVITMLCDRNILDRSVEGYLAENAGCTKLEEILSNTANRLMQIQIDSAGELLNARFSNQAITSGRVVGTGVRVYTSDPLAYFLLASHENNVVEKQLSNANAEFKRRMSASASDIGNRETRRLSDEIYNNWYPAAQDSVILFTYSLMDSYMRDLGGACYIDLAFLEKISIERSKAILDNLGMAQNKTEALQQAFEFCPYNIDIFYAIIDDGFADDNLVQAMQSLGVQNQVESHYRDIFKEQLAAKTTLMGIKETIITFKPTISLFKSNSWSKLINSFTLPYKERFIQKCSMLQKLPASLESIEKWCKKNIGNDSAMIAECHSESVLKIIDKYLLTALQEQDYQILCELGYEKEIWIEININTEDDSLSGILEYYTQHITPSILEYIEEVKRRKSKYDDKKIEYDRYISTKTQQMKKLNAKLKGAGLFAFSHKRDIKRRLGRLQQAVDEYADTCGLNKTKDDFEFPADSHLKEEERACKAQQEKIARQEAHEKALQAQRKKRATIILASAFFLITGLLLIVFVVIPKGKYNKAQSFMSLGDYDQAISLFQSIYKYKSINANDLLDQIEQCKYGNAIALFQNGDFRTAVTMFEQLPINANYDKANYIAKCRNVIGTAEYNAGNYEAAIDEFQRAGSAGDKDLMNASYYQLALGFAEAGDLQQAETKMIQANDYMDAKELLTQYQIKRAGQLLEIGETDNALIVLSKIKITDHSKDDIEKLKEACYTKQGKSLVKEINESGYVNASSVNLRYEANTDSAIIKKLDKYTTVSVIVETDGWYQINFDGNKGYVKEDYISIGKSEIKPKDTEINNTQLSNSTALPQLAPSPQPNAITQTLNLDMLTGTWRNVYNDLETIYTFSGNQYTFSKGMIGDTVLGPITTSGTYQIYQNALSGDYTLSCSGNLGGSLYIRNFVANSYFDHISSEFRYYKQ